MPAIIYQINSESRLSARADGRRRSTFSGRGAGAVGHDEHAAEGQNRPERTWRICLPHPVPVLGEELLGLRVVPGDQFGKGPRPLGGEAPVLVRVPHERLLTLMSRYFYHYLPGAGILIYGSWHLDVKRYPGAMADGPELSPGARVTPRGAQVLDVGPGPDGAVRDEVDDLVAAWHAQRPDL